MWLLDTLSCLLLSCPSTEKTSERTLERTLDKTPVVCWHGVNDDADSCSGLLSTLPSDVYTVSVQLGQSLEQDKYSSVFLGMMDQVKAGCELLAGDPRVSASFTRSDIESWLDPLTYLGDAPAAVDWVLARAAEVLG